MRGQIHAIQLLRNLAARRRQRGREKIERADDPRFDRARRNAGQGRRAREPGARVGMAMEWISAIQKATAAIRFRLRMERNARFRVILPAWIPDLLSADVALAQFGPGQGNGPSGRDDFGRMNVTGDPDDIYRFRSTMLRNVERVIQGKGEQVRLALVCLFLSGAGLGSAQGVFWSIPTGFLHRAIAAGGITLINLVGNIGSLAGPYSIGWIRAHSESFAAPVWFVSLVMISGALLLHASACTSTIR